MFLRFQKTVLQVDCNSLKHNKVKRINTQSAFVFL